MDQHDNPSNHRSKSDNSNDSGGGETKEVTKNEKDTENESDREEVHSDSSNSDDGSADSPKSTVLNAEATAYIAMCDSGCTGITATGVDVRETIYHKGRRVVAVDPDVIPLGSRLILNMPNGNSIKAIAADTGGAIDGNRIDILMPTEGKALNFGRRTVEVTVQ